VGMCVHAMQYASNNKTASLKVENSAQQLLGYLPLAFVHPG